jgi:hypothetical protein
MKTPTHRPSRATAIAAVAFATLKFATAPAATRESWPQRIEADWLLAEEVAAQDQLGGLITTKADSIHAIGGSVGGFRRARRNC